MAYNAELQMLRELAFWSLPQMRCCFCNKLFMLPIGLTYGHRRHGKVHIKLAFHHMDNDRENNALENIGLCHSACHKKHHQQKRAEAKRLEESLNENPTS